MNRSLESRVAEQLGEIERMSRLKRFLAPQIAELVLNSGDETLLDSHRRDVTVVFCDLRGFTAFAETAEPEEVMTVLREYHDGLASRFRADAASKALEIAHRQVFYTLAAYSLEELVRQLEIYLDGSRERPQDVLRIWQKLEPYRLALPMDTNAAVARLFISNLRLALAILQRPARAPAGPSGA